MLPPLSFLSLCRHPFTAFCHWMFLWKSPEFPPRNWLILKCLNFMAVSVYSWNSVNSTKMSHFDDSVLHFPGMSDISLFQQNYFLSQIWAYFVLLCFVLLSTSRIPFICVLDLCCQTFLSVIFSTYFHLLVLFLCILCSFLKTVFHIINFVFGLCILSLFTLIYLLVVQWYYFCCQFLSSTASFPFISFWCLIILSLISSFIVFLLIVVCNFLLRSVLSK